jgi:hypothetical protein
LKPSSLPFSFLLLLRTRHESRIMIFIYMSWRR